MYFKTIKYNDVARTSCCDTLFRISDRKEAALIHILDIDNSSYEYVLYCSAQMTPRTVVLRSIVCSSEISTHARIHKVLSGGPTFTFFVVVVF